MIEWMAPVLYHLTETPTSTAPNPSSVGGVNLTSSSGILTFLLGGGLIGFFAAGYQLYRNIKQGKQSDEENMLKRAQDRFEMAHKDVARAQRATRRASLERDAWQRYAAMCEYRLERAGAALPDKPSLLRDEDSSEQHHKRHRDFPDDDDEDDEEPDDDLAKLRKRREQ